MTGLQAGSAAKPQVCLRRSAIKQTDVGVAVHNGVVTLTGIVESLAKRCAA